jgi:hypothetical protein
MEKMKNSFQVWNFKAIAFLVSLFQLTNVQIWAQTSEPSQFSPSLPYHQMLKEGKKWNYKNIDFDEIVTYFSMVLHGDTLIDGKKCKKMYRIDNGIERYRYAWYEDDKKLYLIPKESDSFIMQYDFNRLNKYDAMPCTDYDPVDYAKYLIGVDVIKSSSGYMNRYRYSNYDEEWFTFCVEGVGGPDGLPMPWFQPLSNEYYVFLSCEEDGKCLCTAEEMNGEAVDPSTLDIEGGAHLKQKTESRKQTVFDLAGRKLSSIGNLRPGIYIRGGKKVALVRAFAQGCD